MTELIAKVLGHWFLEKTLAQLPAPLRGFVVFVSFSGLIFTAIYLAWTTWTVNRIVRSSLGRNPRLGEDTSLNAWMRASSEALDTANRELSR
jgi:hypothetical protein